MPSKESPLVSVVIPVYNGADYLFEAIDSVLEQTYPNFEVLLIDDGSTDGTWDIIQSYGERVRGFHKTNGGVASALNLGIREMRGEWFAWLSHDDLWLPTKLKEQVHFLINKPQFKACYTDYLVIDEQGRLLRTVSSPWYPRPIAIRMLFSGMYINGSTMIVSRECFENLGLYREELRYTQDAEMWFRILACYDIGRVSEVLGKQRVHPRQASVREQGGHLREMLEMYAQVFERLPPETILENTGVTGDLLINRARALCWFADRMAMDRRWHVFARAYYRQSLDLWPSWRNKARLGLALCRTVLPAYRKTQGQAARLVRGIRRPGSQLMSFRP